MCTCLCQIYGLNDTTSYVIAQIVMFFFLFFVCVVLSFFFFFFQAEDGIRDHCVTGVQTCALPIWLRAEETAAHSVRAGPAEPRPRRCRNARRSPPRAAVPRYWSASRALSRVR